MKITTLLLVSASAVMAQFDPSCPGGILEQFNDVVICLDRCGDSGPFSCTSWVSIQGSGSTQSLPFSPFTSAGLSDIGSPGTATVVTFSPPIPSFAVGTTPGTIPVFASSSVTFSLASPSSVPISAQSVGPSSSSTSISPSTTKSSKNGSPMMTAGPMLIAGALAVGLL